MNRRLFLAKAVAWVGALLGISSVSAEGDVGIPVEDCPCCCTADEGVTWYSCDDWGNPLEGDPAGCEALLPEEEEPTPEDDWTDDDDWTPAEEPERVPVDWSAVELPNTGSGPEWFWSDRYGMMCRESDESGRLLCDETTGYVEIIQDQVKVASTQGFVPGYIKIDDEWMLMAEVKDETTLNVVRWVYPTIN